MSFAAAEKLFPFSGFTNYFLYDNNFRLNVDDKKIIIPCVSRSIQKISQSESKVKTLPCCKSPTHYCLLLTEVLFCSSSLRLPTSRSPSSPVSLSISSNLSVNLFCLPLFLPLRTNSFLLAASSRAHPTRHDVRSQR